MIFCPALAAASGRTLELAAGTSASYPKRGTKLDLADQFFAVLLALSVF